MRARTIQTSAIGGLSADSATDPDALRLLAGAVDAGAGTDRGRGFLRRALSLAPSSMAILRLLEISQPGQPGQPGFARRRQVLERPLRDLFDAINQYRLGGEPARAESWILRLLALAPQHEGAETSWNALAACAHGRGDMSRAGRALRRALALAPDWDELHGNLSEVERLAENNVEGALRSARRALVFGAHSAGAYTNLGLAMASGELDDGGLRCFRVALAIDPSRAASYANLANSLLLARSYVDSARWATRGLALERTSMSLMTNLGYAWLCLGDLKRGFDAYELRMAEGNDLSTFMTRVMRPRWQGESLSGKTILIWGEQGIGDQLLFGRYLQFIDTTNARVILEVEARLVPLFKRAFPHFEVLANSDQNGELFARLPIDLQVAMGSLPGVLLDVSAQMVSEAGAEVSSFDPHYLYASARRREEIRRDLGFSSGRRRVAVSWRGGSTRQAIRRHSYMVVSQFAEIFRDFDGDVVNVQYSHTPEEVDYLRGAVGRFVHPEQIDLKQDIEGVAAILAECDLLITASTAVIWLGAALGMPVWNFLTGWQWATFGTEHCPAFPNVRHYWRRLGESWTDVAGEIRSDLGGFRAGAGSAAPLPLLSRT